MAKPPKITPRLSEANARSTSNRLEEGDAGRPHLVLERERRLKVCYHQSQDTIAFKKAMLQAAEFKVLYVDHTKFTRRALHALVPVSAFDQVIVDDETPVEIIEQIRARGTPVEVAMPVDDEF